MQTTLLIGATTVAMATAFIPQAPTLNQPSLGSLFHVSPLTVGSATRHRPVWMSIVPDTKESGTSDSPTLRNIEKKMEQYSRQREEALEKANLADEQLQELQAQKQHYLKGIEAGEITPDGGNFSETTARSAVKALMWRVIAGGVTFATSLRISGSVKTALTIVGSDFFTKALTMFIGERLMNKSQAGRKSGSDNVGRSLAKALLWRVFAICNTLVASFIIAGNLSMASKIAGLDAIFKTSLMFAYERVWAKVSWGKEYIIEFAI